MAFGYDDDDGEQVSTRGTVCTHTVISRPQSAWLGWPIRAELLQLANAGRRSGPASFEGERMSQGETNQESTQNVTSSPGVGGERTMLGGTGLEI